MKVNDSNLQTIEGYIPKRSLYLQEPDQLDGHIRPQERESERPDGLGLGRMLPKAVGRRHTSRGISINYRKSENPRSHLECQNQIKNRWPVKGSEKVKKSLESGVHNEQCQSGWRHRSWPTWGHWVLAQHTK